MYRYGLDSSNSEQVSIARLVNMVANEISCSVKDGACIDQLKTISLSEQPVIGIYCQQSDISQSACSKLKIPNLKRCAVLLITWVLKSEVARLSSPSYLFYITFGYTSTRSNKHQSLQRIFGWGWPWRLSLNKQVRESFLFLALATAESHRFAGASGVNMRGRGQLLLVIIHGQTRLLSLQQCAFLTVCLKPTVYCFCIICDIIRAGCHRIWYLSTSQTPGWHSICVSNTVIHVIVASRTNGIMYLLKQSCSLARSESVRGQWMYNSTHS